MNILSILLFAISSSSDNLVVGLSYGAKKVKINLISNLMISVISGVGTFLAMLSGKAILKLLPVKCSNIIGSGILILFGIYLLVNWFRNDNADTDISEEYQLYENTLRNPKIIDKNDSKTIDFKEALILGMVLCLNNIGLGIGASITGLNIYITPLLSFLFSIILIPAGYYLGEKIICDRFSSYSEIISICIIIILGIYELFV